MKVATYDAYCPACQNTITRGAQISLRSELGDWVHEACGGLPPPTSSFTARYRAVKALDRRQARSVAMSLGLTVTREKRYVDHREVCARAAGAPDVSDEKWANAVALARGGDSVPNATPNVVINVSSDSATEVKALRDQLAAARRQLDAAAVSKVTEVVVKIEGRADSRVDGAAHRQLPKLLKMLGAGVNVWMAGPAGSGKTTAAEQAAKALGLTFYFNGAIDTEYKLSGFVDAQGRVVSTAFRRAFTEGGLYLFDEVDASLPGATLAFNAALANGACDFPGATSPVPRHPDFRCVAAGNTWGLGATAEYVGRCKMDAAFLDRFVQLTWDYDEALEQALASNAAWTKRVQALRAAAKRRGLKVVISPRASIHGGRLLAAGLTEDEVLDATVRAKLTKTDWDALAAEVR